MKKVLFVATVTSHINSFHIPYLKWFKEQNYEVHVASNGEKKIEYCDKHYNLLFERFPLKKNNLKVYKELKKIINENKYEIIHCHTPVGGVLSRLAARNARKKGTKVIYTAHGFHFYKGAPLINWIIYYPIEKMCAKWTDCLITINSEDYDLAKRKLKIKKIERINGVGLETERLDKKITEKEKKKLRNSLDLKEDDIVLSYIAELNKNKNQILLIEVMKLLIKENRNFKLLLVGDGTCKEKYQKEIKKRNLDGHIKLLGRREDINAILSITKIYVASSIREGLPVNIMEAMYMHLPLVATINRGHRELIKNNINGYLVKNNDCCNMKNKILQLSENNKLYDDISKNQIKSIEKLLIHQVKKELEKIYMNL